MAAEIVTADEVEVIMPLTGAEQSRLDQDEAVIESGLATFVEVGRALADIRDQRLYRLTHPTFAKYADDRWGLGRTTYQGMIRAARVADSIETVLTDVSTVPKTDVVIRPLAQYRTLMRKQAKLVEALNDETPEDPDTDVIRDNLADAWGAVVDEAQNRGERITERLVTEVLVAEKLIPDKPKVQWRKGNLRERMGHVADMLRAAQKKLDKLEPAQTKQDKENAQRYAAMCREMAERFDVIAEGQDG